MSDSIIENHLADIVEDGLYEYWKTPAHTLKSNSDDILKKVALRAGWRRYLSEQNKSYVFRLIETPEQVRALTESLLDREQHDHEWPVEGWLERSKSSTQVTYAVTEDLDNAESGFVSFTRNVTEWDHYEDFILIPVTYFVDAVYVSKCRSGTGTAKALQLAIVRDFEATVQHIKHLLRHAGKDVGSVQFEFSVGGEAVSQKGAAFCRQTLVTMSRSIKRLFNTPAQRRLIADRNAYDDVDYGFSEDYADGVFNSNKLSLGSLCES